MGEKLLRKDGVLERWPVSKATLYRRVADGSFPSPVKFGGHRATFWRESDVDEFIKKAVQVQAPSRLKEAKETLDYSAAVNAG